MKVLSRTNRNAAKSATSRDWGYAYLFHQRALVITIALTFLERCSTSWTPRFVPANTT